ncbi:MAG TPA: DUF1801 domain-containing protein [Terriglobia bacterium]|jgi:uncharacterized protein YdhG (YjbR/CyaY superfamily)|nr:DUF1801 domain-containing protein [Terriglobia bacterium]
MKGTPAKDVDAYLAALPAKVRATLEKLRKTIRAAAPKAEETISYQIPCFNYFGPLVYFAAFKDHCSFFPGSKAILKTFKDELKPYRTSAGTIQFSVEKPLPATLVRRIVKARRAENETRFAHRQLKAKTSVKSSAC